MRTTPTKLRVETQSEKDKAYRIIGYGMLYGIPYWIPYGISYRIWYGNYMYVTSLHYSHVCVIHNLRYTLFMEVSLMHSHTKSIRQNKKFRTRETGKIKKSYKINFLTKIITN